MSVLVRSDLELAFSFQGKVNFLRRHNPLFNDAVRNYDRLATSEKVEHPVIDSLKAHPKFVNAVPQEISLWSPQFVTKLL